MQSKRFSVVIYKRGLVQGASAYTVSSEKSFSFVWFFNIRFAISISFRFQFFSVRCTKLAASLVQKWNFTSFLIFKWSYFSRVFRIFSCTLGRPLPFTSIRCGVYCKFPCDLKLFLLCCCLLWTCMHQNVSTAMWTSNCHSEHGVKTWSIM